MKYKFGVVKRITLLLMTMALAVAMVACEAAAGKPGEPGEPGAPGAPGETPKLAPVIKVPFEPVALMVEGDAAGPIDVSAHFYDPEGEALTYAIAVAPEGFVTAELAEGMLTITPVAEGSATITVTATDPDSKSTSASIAVTVAPEGMMPPVKVGTIDAVSLDVGNTHEISDISQYFSEPEEEMLTYSVAVVPALIATAMLDGTTLTIRGDAYGTATVTVTATDEDGLSDTQEISVTVAVPAPPTPDPMPEAPMAVGMIPPMTVDVGDDSSVDVSTYFSPTGLTYTAASSDTTKASVAVAGSSVTITGVAVGEAKVTVTATSDGMSAEQMIDVTVEEPDAPYKPEAVTIDGVGETENVNIDPGQSLRSLQPTKVSFTSSGQTWTIKALEKGVATVRVLNSDNTVDTTIEVTINNTPPEVQEDAEAEDITSVVLTAESTPVDKNGGAYGAPTVEANGERQYLKVLIDFSDLFTDADGDSDIKEYVAESQERYVDVVTEIFSGVAATNWGVVLDVELATGYSFPIEVYAVDDDGDMSDPVQIQIEALEPLNDIYRVTQNAADGSFAPAPLQVWRRKGIAHSLFFLDYEGDGSMGFNFVKVFEQDLIADGLWFDFDPTHAAAVPVEAPSPVPAADAADAAPYFTIETGGAVDAATLAFPSDDATGTFTLKGDKGMGTITYNLHVVVCTGALGPPVSECATGDDLVVQEWRTVSKTLTLNIVDSSEDYDS